VRARQRYQRLSKGGLVDRLLAAERSAAEWEHRFLLHQDDVLTWRLRAEAAEKRLSLYWTSEEQLTEALVEIPYRADDLDQLEQSLHETITRIQQQQFAVLEPPSQTVCKSCDIRSLCRRERIIG
jgi:CRISPR/Cas system-associated exonuclease Cas4 (RecB family)